MLGSWTSARQIATRWRMPPDSWRGSRPANSSIFAMRSSSIARGAYLARGSFSSSIGKQHVLQHRAPRQQHRALEHDADFAARARHVRILDADLARGGTDQSGDHHEQRALAAAARPQHAEELSVADVERNLADRFELAITFLSAAMRTRAAPRLGVGGADGWRGAGRGDCRPHRAAPLRPFAAARERERESARRSEELSDSRRRSGQEIFTARIILSY